MSPEDQFSPAIHSREIVHGQTKQYLKLQEACANRSAQDSRMVLRGVVVLGRLSGRAMALQGMEKKKKVFQGRSLFPLHSRAMSTHQPALLPTLATAGQYCWPLVVRRRKVQEGRAFRKPGLWALWLGSLETGKVAWEMGSWGGNVFTRQC